MKRIFSPLSLLYSAAAEVTLRWTPNTSGRFFDQGIAAYRDLNAIADDVREAFAAGIDMGFAIMRGGR